MLTPYLFTHFLIAATQLLTGVLANGLIVAVNMVDLIQQRQMAPLDLLTSCLAASRICLQVLIFLVNLVAFSFMKQTVLVENFMILMFVNDWGLWLATWLGVFYCAKIATIPHPVFFWLKMRISKMVPWLVLGSALYASISTGIHKKYMWTFYQKFALTFFSKNATLPEEVERPFSMLFIQLMVPLFIFLMAVLLLIFSLGRHAQQMRTISTGTRNPNRGAHIKAMLSVLSFLVLYFSHYMTAILLCSQILHFGSLFLFFTLVVGAYPSVHSVILILGNPKMKQNAKRFLLCGQCRQ